VATPDKRRRDLDPELEFLVVDDFLRDLIGARALKTAFELGLIDHLMTRHPSTPAELGETAKADRMGLGFLLDRPAFTIVEPALELRTRKPCPLDNLPVAIGHGQFKDVLCQIHRHGSSIHVGFLLSGYADPCPCFSLAQ
jgi:hypothetical protein